MTGHSAERGARAQAAIAAFLAQIPEPRLSAEGPQLPTRADLDVTTAATAAAIADPAASVLDVHQAATLEEATFTAYLHRSEAEAEFEAGI